MRPVPFLPALLGLLLVTPFIYATAALLGLFTPPRYQWADPYELLNSYGAIYLAMLGGVYWGFAAKRPTILDMLIALVPPLTALAASFDQLPVLPYAIAITGMLVIDILYIARGLAPKWWLSLRLYTGIIAVSALVYAYYA